MLDEGVKSLPFWTKDSYGNALPIVFLHVEGDEEALTMATKEGNDASKKNNEEVEYVVSSNDYHISA